MSSITRFDSSSARISNRIGEGLTLGQIRGGRATDELTPRQRAKVLQIVQARGHFMHALRVAWDRRRAVQAEQLAARKAIIALQQELRGYSDLMGGGRKPPKDLENDIAARSRALEQLEQSLATIDAEIAQRDEQVSALTEMRSRLLAHPLVASNHSLLREIDLWEGAQ